MGTRVVKSGTLLALLVLAAFLALIPSSAYASANRDNALECASNLLGAMISYDSYPSMYSVGALDEDDLWLENALPIYDEESQANGSQELFLWPIMEGNRVVATMLEVPDGAAEPVFRLSSDYIDAVEEVLASDGLRVLRKSGVSEIVSADCPDGSAMSARAMLTDAFQ